MRKGQGISRIYTCLQEKLCDRNHQTIVEKGKIAARDGKTILGIKGPSALADLPKFDLFSGMVPDYLHCVLLGVCRQLAMLWMDSNSSSELKHLLSINPPGIVAQVTRSLTDYKFWKAHEW